MEEGKIEIDSIEPIGFPDITSHLARESGFLGLTLAINGNRFSNEPRASRAYGSRISRNRLAREGSPI
jgi:hypothetical protein